MGVNRISLGLQSFEDSVLREMGRLHTVADSLEAVALARAAGFGNLSLDLILGWPGETPGRWSRGLKELASLEPDHVEPVCVLEVEGKTLLSHQAQKGALDLPEDDLVADLLCPKPSSSWPP